MGCGDTCRRGSTEEYADEASQRSVVKRNVVRAVWPDECSPEDVGGRRGRKDKEGVAAT